MSRRFGKYEPRPNKKIILAWTVDEPTILHLNIFGSGKREIPKGQQVFVQRALPAKKGMPCFEIEWNGLYGWVLSKSITMTLPVVVPVPEVPAADVTFES